MPWFRYKIHTSFLLYDKPSHLCSTFSHENNKSEYWVPPVTPHWLTRPCATGLFLYPRQTDLPHTPLDLDILSNQYSEAKWLSNAANKKPRRASEDSIVHYDTAEGVYVTIIWPMLWIVAGVLSPDHRLCWQRCQNGIVSSHCATVWPLKSLSDFFFFCTRASIF